MNAFDRYGKSPLTFFVFHNPIALGYEKVIRQGMELDHAAVNYKKVLNHFVEMAIGYHPECRVLYITGLSSFDLEKVDTVRLNLAGMEPMYDRVKAMRDYVHSSAFGPTIFLDSDAFINRRLSDVLANNDLCLTYNSDNIHPINEGVIFCSSKAIAMVFFDMYLSEYERMPSEYRRWGGGQMSLNKIAKHDSFAGKITFLDSEQYNFTPEHGREYTGADLIEKYILHLKGKRKVSSVTLDGIIRLQKLFLVHNRRTTNK